MKRLKVTKMQLERRFEKTLRRIDDLKREALQISDLLAQIAALEERKNASKDGSVAATKTESV